MSPQGMVEVVVDVDSVDVVVVEVLVEDVEVVDVVDVVVVVDVDVEVVVVLTCAATYTEPATRNNSRMGTKTPERSRMYFKSGLPSSSAPSTNPALLNLAMGKNIRRLRIKTVGSQPGEYPAEQAIS
jgi:hypothetical protein